MHAPGSSSSSSPSPPATADNASAPSQPPAGTMQIFIKSMAGETVPLTLPSDATVADLRSTIASHASLPSGTVRLLFGGKSLTDASSPLSAYAIAAESTVSLAPALRGGANRLPRCDYKKDTRDKCTKPIERIVGDCGFCKGHFCSKHRLLESHNCEGLEDCKKESHERNADKLNAERTVAIKGI